MQEDSEPVTVYLQQLSDGDASAADRLVPHVYEDLRRVAQKLFQSQRGEHTLQPTALVHEVYLRIAGSDGQDWKDRKHFLRVAALAMRQLLTDYARYRGSEKRLGGKHRVLIEDVELGEESSNIDLLALDEALTELSELDERQARIVELRFLAGLTLEETAEALDVSIRTVSLDWKMARAWLAQRLEA